MFKFGFNFSEREYGREACALEPPALKKLSPKTQQLLLRAEGEARARDDNHIGTEHLVLGLYSLGDSAARRALEALQISRSIFAGQLKDEEGPSPPGRIPLTPRARMIIGLAGSEATRSTSDSIAPEHVLLGVIRESQKWEVTGEPGPHHLRDAAQAVGATLADIERCVVQQINERSSGAQDTV